jgi:RNA polymerase sigma-70 factor (ECF subfamily)
VVSLSDGGGTVTAALRPIVTPERVARGFLGNARKLHADRVWIEEINGQPAIVAMHQGEPLGVVLLEIAGDRVRRLYAVTNPDKLRALAGRTHDG